MSKGDIKEKVREGYGRIAVTGGTCCSSGCCCGQATAEAIAKNIGYSDEDLEAVPEGSNLGLGCGNPTAFASLKEGDTVVDLGSGAGFDCFIAARKVGKTGKVIGIDMTPEMLERARKNAESQGFGNVEFRRGDIEKLPVSDNFADFVISNCVINLSPDKGDVFKESFRVLKPGGMLFVTDMVLLKELSPDVRESVEHYVGCISGAEFRDKYLDLIKKAGFSDVQVLLEKTLPLEAYEMTGVYGDISHEVGESIASIMVSAIKSKSQKGPNNMTKLEILGAGCPSCRKLMELTGQAAHELDMEYEIVKVDDIMKIMEYGVLSTPALVVNGKIKVAGRVPKIDELKKLIV